MWEISSLQTGKKFGKEGQEPKIGGPALARRRMHFDMGKAELEHERKVLWKWILSYLKPHRKGFFVFITLLTAAFIFNSYIPVISAKIIDAGIITGNKVYIIMLGIILLSGISVMGTIMYIGGYGLGKISQNVVYKIRTDLFSHLQDMGIVFFDRRNSGDIISVMTNDVDQLNNFVGMQLAAVFIAFIQIIMNGIFMFMLNPILAAVSMLIIPVLFVMFGIIRKIAIRRFKRTRLTISKVTSTIQEHIAGAKVVKAYGQEERAKKEFDAANLENYKAMVNVRRIFATFFPLVSTVVSIFTVLIIIIGIYLDIYNISVFGITVSVGVMAGFITILSQFFRPFMNLVQLQQILEAALAAADRIYGLLEEDERIPEPERPVELPNRIRGEVEFKGVFFAYPKRTAVINGKKARSAGKEEKIGTGRVGIGMQKGRMERPKNTRKFSPHDNIDTPPFGRAPLTSIRKENNTDAEFVLENINLKIDAGKTVAIVGETGAGKTTMIKLIARFYDPQKGSITIDGIDIRKIKKKELRSLIGLVPQEPFIFTGTIRENILYAFDEITPDLETKMIEVSKMLGLHNFVSNLPEGYDTYLSEMGTNISIGQRQLIGFARALITDPPILILDEATASVDPYTESLMQEALEKIRKGRTTIVIAHRLTTVINADKIVVLSREKKGIAEIGTHRELVRKGGIYSQLLKMQFPEAIPD